MAQLYGGTGQCRPSSRNQNRPGHAWSSPTRLVPKRVDGDCLAVNIEERSARVPRIDVHVRNDRARPYAGRNPRRDGKALIERVAHRHETFTRNDRCLVHEVLEGNAKPPCEVVRMEPQHGDVCVRVAGEYLNTNARQRVDHCRDLVAFGGLDHMCIRYDHATERVREESGAVCKAGLNPEDAATQSFEECRGPVHARVSDGG